MSDSLLALILVVSFIAAMALARWFKSLDGDFWAEAGTPLVAGAVAGIVVRLIPFRLDAIVIGILLTAAALYVRLTGRESEPADGMILGALLGAAAAVPLMLLDTTGELRAFSACVLAGAIAGYGVTFALTHVSDKLRQLFFDAITAAVAVGAAFVPQYLERAGIAQRSVAVGTASAIPLLVVLTVFKQWPAVRAELRHEASLGVIDDADVRATAHPFLRLGRGGWTDAGAHREFVRLANKIALRKRQQRGRPDEIARLYQLEIIKIRMHLQEMARIDRLTRAQRAAEGEVPSDTMARG
ncbi:MAG TPA: hypothetical protein VF698_01940 [Thermoanaerobaculia bacterium]|jgi:hypothetical protein